jgi:hypothetical protein
MLLLPLGIRFGYPSFSSFFLAKSLLVFATQQMCLFLLRLLFSLFFTRHHPRSSQVIITKSFSGDYHKNHSFSFSFPLHRGVSNDGAFII